MRAFSHLHVGDECEAAHEGGGAVGFGEAGVAVVRADRTMSETFALDDAKLTLAGQLCSDLRAKASAGKRHIYDRKVGHVPSRERDGLLDGRAIPRISYPPAVSISSPAFAIIASSSAI